ARLEGEDQRLPPLRLVQGHDRAAAAGGRLPGDAAELVAADVLAQALELARRRLAADQPLAVRPLPGREQRRVAQLEHVGPGDRLNSRGRMAALAKRDPERPE